MQLVPTSDELLNHGIRNVWCSPDQDGQFIFKPARLTKSGGAINSVSIMNRQYTLPERGRRFHVFQIGAVNVRKLNINAPKRQWHKAGNWCRLNQMEIVVYTHNGFVMPRDEVWFLITNNGAIIVAVRSIPTISIDLDVDGDLTRHNDVFIRFYSNAFFESDRRNDDGHPHVVTSSARMVESADDVTAMQNYITALSNEPGERYAYIDGRFHYPIRAADVTIGTYLEVIHDTTIDRAFEMPLEDKRVFTSTKDSIKKYVVRGPEVDHIRYLDDCDFFLVKEEAGYSEGLMVHRNAPENIRMLTPGDYSVSIPLLQHLRGSTEPALAPGLEDLKLVVFSRKSGYDRQLVPDRNRLYILAKELDYLADEDIRPLNEPNHPVSVWSAAGLEDSPYTRLMGAARRDITSGSVAEAYGYNGASKLIGDGMIKVTGTSVTLPPALMVNSTVYEYDIDGLLLDVYNHASGDTYIVNNPSCDFVEVLTGEGAETTEHIDSGPVLYIDPGLEYRAYRRPLNGEWEDVTGHDDKYVVAPNSGRLMFTWSNYDQSTYDYRVINDKFYVDREEIFVPGTVELRMQLGGYPVAGAFQPLDIPTADVAVWLNGHSLTVGTDVIVHWPFVTVISSEYVLNDPSEMNVMRVRARGFSDPNDLSFKANKYRGFIQHGIMTDSTIYDLAENKVLRYIVNGRSYIPSDVQFIVGDSVDPVYPPNHRTLLINNDRNHPLNGKPYSINRNYVGLNQFVDTSTRDLKTIDDKVDDEVSAYFKLNLRSLHDRSGPSFITHPYELFSPFLAKIIFGCIRGEDGLLPEDIPDNLVKADVDQLLDPYLELLEVDPTQDHIFDLFEGQQVAILPHPYNGNDITVNVAQWRLINFVVTHYLHDRVQISLGRGMQTVVGNPPEDQW